MVFFLQLPLRLAKLPSVHCAILTVCALSRVSCKMSSMLSHSSSLKYDLKHLHKSHIERWASSSFRVLVKRGMSQTAENWPLSQDPRSYKKIYRGKGSIIFFSTDVHIDRTFFSIFAASRSLWLFWNSSTWYKMIRKFHQFSRVAFYFLDSRKAFSYLTATNTWPFHVEIRV